MQTTEFERFNAVMNGMGKVYEREIDTVLLDAYWLALRDWSLQEFEAACAHLMRTSQFMPRPSDFNELRKVAEPSANEAWLKALNHDWRGQGTIRDPRIATVVSMLGGYEVITLCPQDKLGFVEKRFLDHYRDLDERQEIRKAVPEVTWRNGKALPLADIAKQLT